MHFGRTPKYPSSTFNLHFHGAGPGTSAAAGSQSWFTRCKTQQRLHYWPTFSFCDAVLSCHLVFEGYWVLNISWFNMHVKKSYHVQTAVSRRQPGGQRASARSSISNTTSSPFGTCLRVTKKSSRIKILYSPGNQICSIREVNPRCVSSDLLYRISSALLHVHFFCEVSSLVVFVYFYFFLNAMEFVPLWSHCHRLNASRWSCWEPDGRTDAGRINRFWNQTDARPLGEMRFYAFSQYERENDFGSHCLPTPSSPQPLPKFLLLSIMFNYWQTQKQPSIVSSIIALLIQCLFFYLG